jgi:hypothetical protein
MLCSRVKSDDTGTSDLVFWQAETDKIITADKIIVPKRFILEQVILASINKLNIIMLMQFYIIIISQI